MAFVMTVDQQVDVTVSYVDSQGNPATVDGIPVWDTSDSNVCAVQGSADGMSAVVAAGNVGQAQISVTADADLGAGTTQIIGTLGMSIVAGEAVSAILTPGTPTDKLSVQPISP